MSEYRCSVPAIGIDAIAFYEADTPAKAKYRCLLAIRDAGYRRLSFTDIKVRLARVNEEVMERQAQRRDKAELP